MEQTMQKMERMLTEMKKEIEMGVPCVPERMQEMRECYELLLPVARSSGAVISWERETLVPGTGSICLEGDEVNFDDPAVLARAAELAGRLEIFPLANGTVRLFFSFYELR